MSMDGGGHLSDYERVQWLTKQNERLGNRLQDAVKNIKVAWENLVKMVGIDTANAMAENSDSWQAIKTDGLNAGWIKKGEG